MKTGFIGLGAMGAPMAGHLHARGLLAVVGNKLQAKLPDSVKSKVPTSMVPWVPTITTGVLAAVAYGALRMSKNAKLSKLSVPVLIGGAAATALHAMVAIKVKNSAAGGPPEISLAGPIAS